MALLHPDHWRDLANEFEAASFLMAAQGALESARIDTGNVSGALVHIRNALSSLHPVTRDPEAVEEFEQRLAGTFEEQRSAGPGRLASAGAQAALERARENLARLERQPNPTDGGAPNQ